MRDSSNLVSLLPLKPDYVGFIFYPHSRRFVGERPDPSLAETISQLGAIKRTGVFVDAPIDVIVRKADLFGLDAIQLHGTESAETAKALKAAGLEVIKAFGVDARFDFNAVADYLEAVDYVLFDTKTEQHGGSGRAFDWNILENYGFPLPYFLSGGLDLENLSFIKDFSDERLYALDLNSRFETAPGLKDIEKLKQAFTLIKTSQTI